MRPLKSLSLVTAVATLVTACGGGDSSTASVPAMVALAMQSTASTVVDSNRCSDSALATGAYQWVDHQCVTASELLVAPTASSTKTRASVVATAAASTAIDATAFLDWAEGQLPTIFPGHKPNLTSTVFVYRYYPETQAALGVADGKVYGIGPMTGNALVLLGALTDFTCLVSPTLCAVPGAPTLGAVTAGNASASIAFTAPTSNSSLAITGYTASCVGGGSTLSTKATSSPITVSGLANGTAYQCSVVATNSAGTGAASASAAVTPVAGSTGGTGPASSTAGVQCNYTYSALNTSASVKLTSTSTWTCNSSARVLAANGIPDHAVGTFPNSNNPNTITAQNVAATYTLSPVVVSTTGTTATVVGYGLNGVKFDPGTGGNCDNTGSNCSLIGGSGTWRIEALGQTSFNFGVDTNNAHVQPTGEYHYHGMPEGLLLKQGKGQAMTLIGWASDGFPIYGRYGLSVATDATSAIKVLKASYRTKSTPDANRPATSLYPMGTFLQDWEYAAGSGDLDECNGRTGVTPEFPTGIYHYYATDTYPYFQRCVKGTAAAGTGQGGGLPPPPRG